MVAVDWSGAKRGAKKRIWLAEIDDAGPVRLESGRTRTELIDYLIARADKDENLVVGLDFVFSFPEWFLKDRGVRSAREFWELVERENERWLGSCEHPFWGRPGVKKRAVPAHLRKNERTVYRLTGELPKSPFQIGGAGAVGTASLRGIPHLLPLVDKGFAVWPFDEAALPMVVEIYPRLLTGPVVKSQEKARSDYLEREFPGLPEDWRQKATASEDAFDAAVSALVMSRHFDELRDLPQPEDPVLRLEGAMWWPEETPRAESRLQKALLHAAKLHVDQTRKGGGQIPYVAHLLGVCSLTLEAGGDEDQAIAALLHDAAEDQGGRAALDEIRTMFGDRVARIVEACTDTFEEQKPEWRPRKERYIRRLADEPEEVVLVACADKLYNARSILRDHRRLGDGIFERFTASKDGTLWYYRELADAFARSKLDSWLVDELERTMAELERVASG